MDETIITNHNSLVKPGDLVIHVGDFTLGKKGAPYIAKLHGDHIFLRGSHDKWLRSASEIWERNIEGQIVVACHYAMRVWPKSHYGAWQVYGHSHGHLPPLGKQHDVGVDNNNFFPVSWKELKVIMAGRDDNPNLLKKEQLRGRDETQIGYDNSGCTPGDGGRESRSDNGTDRDDAGSGEGRS
jgi:calcineurin-like phosphoesterase family protein